jgi:hypothetical protein
LRLGLPHALKHVTRRKEAIMVKISAPDSGKVDVEAIKKGIRDLESPKVKRDRERFALFSS